MYGYLVSMSLASLLSSLLSSLLLVSLVTVWALFLRKERIYTQAFVQNTQARALVSPVPEVRGHLIPRQRRRLVR
jgi:hypothetical protein